MERGNLHPSMAPPNPATHVHSSATADKQASQHRVPASLPPPSSSGTVIPTPFYIDPDTPSSSPDIPHSPGLEPKLFTSPRLCPSSSASNSHYHTLPRPRDSHKGKDPLITPAEPPKNSKKLQNEGTTGFMAAARQSAQEAPPLFLQQRRRRQKSSWIQAPTQRLPSGSNRHCKILPMKQMKWVPVGRRPLPEKSSHGPPMALPISGSAETDKHANPATLPSQLRRSEDSIVNKASPPSSDKAVHTKCADHSTMSEASVPANRVPTPLLTAYATDLPVGHPGSRPLPEFCFIPRSEELIDAEESFRLALIGSIDGTYPEVEAEDVQHLLRITHNIYGVHVRRYSTTDFLLEFKSSTDIKKVMRSGCPTHAPFKLTFKRWSRRYMAISLPLQFHVLLQIRNLPIHAWNLSTVATILSSSCTELKPTPDTVARSDFRYFRLLAWTLDPNSIPTGKMLSIPEPREPVGGPPLFLRPEEMMYSSAPTLHYAIEIDILEIQDWRNSSDTSSEEEMEPDHWWTESDDDDNLPGSSSRWGLSKPWPIISRPTKDAANSICQGGHA